jgi:hypothetical protein
MFKKSQKRRSLRYAYIMLFADMVQKCVGLLKLLFAYGAYRWVLGVPDMLLKCDGRAEGHETKGTDVR